ncbi:MAG: tRNA dihydrouridine synthase DusB [Kofleriaceae bacterium]|jgi:nifR3 family TIM-barrel protein|nr:tRNA dihydrouridine synthase DusB [Kofleriaceae bacterium]MBP9207078.1 tRNA dihydrouridine synthase DusB [Kofleriaceae bacterium]
MAPAAPIRIGPLVVETPVILAPMAAVTDLPFRTVCEEFGVGLTITEFLSAHALSKGDPKTQGKMTASLGGRAFGVQIFGREEEPMAQAARMAVAIGASLVDINMGCPAKRVVAGECGSALMREPAMAQRLVRAVVDAVPAGVPVTVKHRAGWNDANRNAPEFACALVEAGAAMITVHGRTRTQGFSGKSDLGIIGQVRAAVPAHIPVVGNGDVVDVAGFQRMRDETGCDAVMIGRGAMGNPWLFAQLREVVAGRPDPGLPTLEQRRDVFRRHVGLIRTYRTGPKVLHEVRKACAWYAKGLYGCNALRVRVWETPTLDALAELLEDYFAQLLDRANRLGLPPEADRPARDGTVDREAAMAAWPDLAGAELTAPVDDAVDHSTALA